LFKKRAVTKAKAGERALKEVAHYQKQADCLYFPRAAFADLIREVALDFKEDIRLFKDAIMVAQVCMEGLVVHVLEMAQVAAIHDGKRHTLQPEDLALVRYISTKSLAQCPANSM
jgi:histone H3/H4